MKTRSFYSIVLIAALIIGTAARAADPLSLKDAYKDHFPLGVAINRTVATGAAERSNRTSDQVQKDIAVVVKHFDSVVSENDLKWASLHPREGKDGYDFSNADVFVKFGESHGMTIVGHTLVWHGQTPSWVFASTQASSPASSAAAAPSPTPSSNQPIRPARGIFDPTKPHASREELLARMREHIHTVVGRYKGRIKVWDVVNEAISDNGPELLRNSPWSQIIGPDFIAKAFEYAHEADPDAILRYNDYGLENAQKRQKLIKLIKSLQAQKVPVMAIGTQTHVSVNWPTFRVMDQTLTELASLGLPIHVTELDVNSAESGQQTTGADISQNDATTQGGLVKDAGQRLADQYANLFKAFLNHQDQVKLVTFWGVNDGVSWRAKGKPLLFDENDNPKPAFEAVIRVAGEATAKSQ